MLSHLATLRLSACSLYGSLPSSIGSLTQLSVLDLSGNEISGTVPTNCGNLTYLNMASNSLSGSIPDSFSALGKLQECHLSSNRLTGSLPNSIARMATLRQLDLSYNALSGALLSTLPKSLISLSLSGNAFTGGLPQLWYQSSLTTLTCFDCGLSGVLPPVWGINTAMQVVDLYKNSLSGLLPSSWSNMSGLSYLSLERNRLSGALPDRWANMSITQLGLALNPFCGTVPSSWRAHQPKIPSTYSTIGNCTRTKFFTHQPSAFVSVSRAFCSERCNATYPGSFPATPQTDDEVANVLMTARNNGTMQYYIMGGGMHERDHSTLRWLNGPLGVTDNGMGTIFFLDDGTKGQCVMPCRYHSEATIVGNVTPSYQLVVENITGNWIMVDMMYYNGQVGCMCQINATESSAALEYDSLRTLTNTPWWEVDPTDKVTFSKSTQRAAAARRNHTMIITISHMTCTTTYSSLTTLSYSTHFFSMSVSASRSASPSSVTWQQYSRNLSMCCETKSITASHTVTEAIPPVTPSMIQKAAEVMASAAAVVSAPLSVAGGSAGAADGALLAVVLQVSCGSGSSQRSSSAGWLRYTLSPFVDFGSLWMIVGNVGIVAVLWALIEFASPVLTWSARWKRSLAMTRDEVLLRASHPSMAISVGMLLSIGVLFGGCHLLSLAWSSVDATRAAGGELPLEVLFVCGASGIIAVVGLRLYAVLLIARVVKPTAFAAPWGNLTPNRLVPWTVWQPASLVCTHGALFTAYRSPLSVRLAAILLFLPVLFTVVASTTFPSGNGACIVQLVTLLAVQGVTLAVVVRHAPFRAPLATPLAAVTCCLMMALISLSFAAGGDGVESARSALVLSNSVCSIVKLLYLIAVRVHRWHVERQDCRKQLGVAASDSELCVVLETLLRDAPALKRGPSNLITKHCDDPDGSTCCKRAKVRRPEPLPIAPSQSLERIVTYICISHGRLPGTACRNKSATCDSAIFS